MARNAKPRKAYRPRPVLVDPVRFAIEGVTPLQAFNGGDGYRALMLKTYLAIDAIKYGKGEATHASMLMGALEVSEVLAHEQRIIADGDMAAIDAARPAIMGMVERGKHSGRFVLKGEELRAIEGLMRAHETQLANCMIGDMDKALTFLRNCNGRPPSWLQGRANSVTVLQLAQAEGG